MTPLRNRVIWCDRGFFPAFYGFCPSEKAWIAELKRLGLKRPVDYPTTSGRCSELVGDGGKLSILVTLAKHCDTIKPVELVGLLAHEATHVWQFLCDNIGDESPSKETEAYAVQAITQELIIAYERTRRRLFS